MCLSGAGADQPVIAARAEALGAGQTISLQAPASGLHDAAAHVLATPSYRQAARRLARIISQHDGAADGAAALEDARHKPHTAQPRGRADRRKLPA